MYIVLKSSAHVDEAKKHLLMFQKYYRAMYIYLQDVPDLVVMRDISSSMVLLIADVRVPSRYVHNIMLLYFQQNKKDHICCYI